MLFWRFVLTKSFFSRTEEEIFKCKNKEIGSMESEKKEVL